MSIRLSESDLPMSSRAFTERLIGEIDETIEAEGLDSARFEKRLSSDEMLEGLYTRVYNELAVADAARRMAEEVDDPQIFIHLLKQLEDEAKHARMLAQRIHRLGGNPADVFDRVDEKAAEFWQRFDGLDLVETTSMLQATTERIAHQRHQHEADYYDEETAEIYRRVITPEEKFHSMIGVNVLRTYCDDRESQQTALDRVNESMAIRGGELDSGIRSAYGSDE